MTLSELLPIVQSLPRADKLQLMQLLASELAQDETILDVAFDTHMVIWSPHDAFDAAELLSQALKDEQSAQP